MAKKSTIKTHKIWEIKGKRRIKRGFVRLLTIYRRGKKVRSGVGTIRIGRVWWNIVVTEHPLRGVMGYCQQSLKLIVVDGTEKDNIFLNTLIHEASHGLDYKRAEGVIERQGSVLADLLTAFGYKN